MPIRPENRKFYGCAKTWRAIRAAVQKRAGDRCETCGVDNHTWRARTRPGEDELGLSDEVRIVLTTAHLDYDPRNNDGFEKTRRVKSLKNSNLRFWCQRCHNRYDAPHRAASRKRHFDEKNGQRKMFGC